MPPKKRVKRTTSGTPTRRSTRRKKYSDDDIPEVYQQMLAEAVANDAQHPRKHRKISLEDVEEPAKVLKSLIEERANNLSPAPLQRDGSRLQQIVLDEDSASLDDDDADFEDVDIGGAEDGQDEGQIVEQKSLQIDLSKQLTTPKKGQQRLRLATPAERALRLSFHKTHLILLLFSIAIRNRWCESSEVQAILKPLVSRKTINQLHLDESEPAWKRSQAFNDSIKAICDIWRATYRVTERGMRRAIWRAEIDLSREIEESEDSLDLDDFKMSAQTRVGSRDLGAQLLCALLRSCAVEARLVCSLQVLPFSAVATQPTPEKQKPAYAYAPSQDFGSSTSLPHRKKLNESPFPIFWVEAFSPATSTWIPLDPLVRNTIGKSKTGFEPPVSDQLNVMSYVIAFEDDGSARDVTRRYTQWFNAKTRKTRVESTKGGEAWYASVIGFFEKKYREDRDAIEDIELARRNEIEGMPKNIQDFKGHPLYVLERHLRRNEVIHPMKEAGKVAVGGGHKSNKLESVFRRRDVHVCRSADAWYRRGRDVKFGEAPLKRSLPKGREVTLEMDEEEVEDPGKALYAEFQTEIYVPPPVVGGRIPRNAFGNLDVYVPSMIPPGAIHVRHPMAVKAAQVLGISYTEAVTGFDFKGRQGTAVINGIVVAATQRIAMVTVVVGLQSQATDEIEAQRSRMVLGIWKKWLAALRIKEQVARDYGDRLEDGGDSMDVDDDAGDETYQDEDAGGGFFAEGPPGSDTDGDHAVPSLALPAGKILLDDLPSPPSYHEIVVVESPHKLPIASNDQIALPNGSQDHNDSLFGDDELGLAEVNPQMSVEVNVGGGFLIEDAEERGGGFMVEDEAERTSEAPVAANDSQLALDITGGGFIVDGGGFEADDDKAVNVEGSEVQVKGSWHDDHHSMSAEDGSTSDPTFQPRTSAQAVPASSIELAAQPPHLPVISVTDGKQEARPDSHNVSLPPASTQSSLLNEEAEDEDRRSHDPDEDEAEPEWLHDSLGFN